jgi:dihydroceramidase
MLALVGVGSFLFHATLRFSLQLCDEVPMLLLIVSFLVGKEDCVAWVRGPAARLRFRIFVLGVLTIATFCYVALFVYDIFVFTFSAAVVVEIGLDLACRPRTWQTRASFCAAVAAIGVGHVVWQLELHLCTTAPRVWPLHMLWHLLSCVGAAFAIAHNICLRREKIEQ